MFLLPCADFLQEYGLTLLLCISAASKSYMVINTDVNCHGELALATRDRAGTARQRRCDFGSKQACCKAGRLEPGGWLDFPA